MVDNALEHAHTHRTLPRRLDDAVEKLINRNLPRATKRRERAARHVKARQLLHELHGGNEHRNRTCALAHNQALKQRHHLIKPAFAQKKAHRLVSGAHRALDNLGTLSDKDTLLGLQHAAKLALGQSHVGVEPLIRKRIDSQNLNGISHSSQPAPFLTAHLYQTRRREAPPHAFNQPDNTVHARRFTPQRDDMSRTHNRDPRHPRPRQSWQPRQPAKLPMQDRRPNWENTCPRDERSGYA